MSNIIAMNFRAAQQTNKEYCCRLRMMNYLESRLPEIYGRLSLLKTIRAPKDVIDNEVRLIASYEYRLFRLRKWWKSVQATVSMLMGELKS